MKLASLTALKRSPSLSPRIHLALKALFLLLFSTATLIALLQGLKVRHDIWFATDGAHFTGDITSAWRWGRMANESGIPYFYEYVETNGDRKNDYPPFRLTTVTLWQKWTMKHYPDATGWRDDYDFTAPLLHTNTCFELASSILVFFIIRLWRRRTHPPRPFRGWISGFFGALLFWFNPAVLWNGHCWPQWDIWLVPFFLAAVLAASTRWWFLAGFLVVSGAMFKGQMLLGAPVLLIWPLVSLQFGPALRFISGFALGAAICAAPWLHPSIDAWIWINLVALALALLWPVMWQKRPRWYFWIPMLILACVAVWPWWAVSKVWPDDSHYFWYIGSPRYIGYVILALAILTRWLPRARWYVYPLCLAIAVYATVVLYDSSMTWFHMGFEFGAVKFDNMMTGTGTYNVPKMLIRYLGWSRDPDQLISLPWIGTEIPAIPHLSEAKPITFHLFARMQYAIAILLCGIGAAVQWKRQDARFLSAMAAPWLLFYMLLTQMHGRYSFWGGAMASLLFGINPGMGMLGVLIAVVSGLGIITNQLSFEPGWSPYYFSLLQRVDPHLGWILALSALICLYVAVAPRGKVKLAPDGMLVRP